MEIDYEDDFQDITKIVEKRTQEILKERKLTL